MTTRIIAHLYLAATIATSVYSQMIMKWRISGRFAGLKIPEGIWPKMVTLFTVLFDPFVFSGLFATFISGLCWMATMSKAHLGGRPHHRRNHRGQPGREVTCKTKCRFPCMSWGIMV